MQKKTFPDGFVWGCATASYQVEGAVREGGRGESIWDRYCSVPGNVLNGQDGSIACDHYHRFHEDIALMKELGMKAYRFSIAWPRIYPQGRGTVNEEGLRFYSDLIDALLKAGIEPYVTLYHWDLPQALQDIGGWANRDTPGYFLDYCRTVMDRFHDRVKNWITLNEPYCVALLGNYEGRMAPGLHDFSTALRVAHHEYVAHGLAVRYFRESGYDGKIGIVLNLMGRLPLTQAPEDIEAGRRADGYLNRWFADPILRGSYPEDMWTFYRSSGVVLPPVESGDLALISQPLDFIGLNYYNDFYVRNAPGRWPIRFEIKNPPHCVVNDRDWPVTEQGFTDMILRLTREYGVKNILISENGTSFHDVVSLDGHVHDGARQDYLHRHILAMHEAIRQGAPVTGYFVWSLLDNFEWAQGYSCRFGIVHVDYRTLVRTIKDSGYWYAGVIAENAVP